MSGGLLEYIGRTLLLHKSFDARGDVFSHIDVSSRFRHFEDEFKGTACDLSGSSYRMPCPYFIQSELSESIKNARNKTINAQCFYLFLFEYWENKT